MTFGEKVRKHREEKGLSQGGLAAAIGTVTNKAVSKWENNATMPGGDTLPLIAAVLGVTEAYLLGHEETPDKSDQSGTGVYEFIPIEQIKPNPDNFYSMAEIETLAASIEEYGLLHNLVVHKAGADNYELISGERRYRACLLLHNEGNADYARLYCKIDSPETNAETELRLITANNQRELSDYEKTTQAERRGIFFGQRHNACAARSER